MAKPNYLIFVYLNNGNKNRYEVTEVTKNEIIGEQMSEAYFTVNFKTVDGYHVTIQKDALAMTQSKVAP